MAVCKEHNVPITSRAQKLKTEDFYDYDLILGMDKSNIQDIRSVMPSDSKAKGQFYNTILI